MKANFRAGRLHACPCFLQAVDRHAMVSAIVRHATSLPIHGEPVTTHHEHGGHRFRIDTDAKRRKTTIRLG